MRSVRARRVTRNLGLTPKIACFNRATVALEVDFDRMLRVLQKYVDRYVAPVWGTPARLVRSTGFVKGMWTLVFLDTADRRGQVGYHDLTPDGLPIAKVFVKTALDSRRPVSRTASHELVEMLVDPAINLWSKARGRTLYAYEAADPVAGYSFKLDGLPMVDFVYPSYFEGFRRAGSTRFDYLGKLHRPLKPSRGGYQIILRNGHKRTIFGSRASAKRFQQEDRRDRRTTKRGHQHHAGCRARPPWGKSLGAIRKRA